MRLGLIGLGRMGLNMSKRLIEGGHEVVVYNRSPEKIDEIIKEGGIGSVSLEDFIRKLYPERFVWLMLPSGDVTDEHIERLKGLMSKGDVIIEGGNTYYKDDIRRAGELQKSGIHYLDAGVSGGIWGLKNGYCTMIGGERKIFEKLEPVFQTLAPAEGYLYCGATGAGHFVKMLHNGIEYALMEAYGEGFQILKASGYGNGVELKNIARLWNSGSVIRSWLLELLESVFSRDPDLNNIKGYVEDSGEARWTVKEALELGVAADLIALSLFKRFNSRQKDVFADKITAALRNEFGGHALAKNDEDIRISSTGAGSFHHAIGEDNKNPGRGNGI